MKKTKSFSGKFLKTFLLLLIPVLVVTTIYIFKAKAQTGDVEYISTYVTVGNTAPVFDVIPKEVTQSIYTSPVTMGNPISFNATATDPNGENYYLIVCSTNSVSGSASGGAPTCGGKRYCVSSSTTSGSQASCTYTTEGTDPEQYDPWENPWYAFVCDTYSGSGGSKCSSSSQGSGGSGSPFYVNHPPAFDSISTSPVQPANINPGQSITWTATASDSDIDNEPTHSEVNGVKLLVCKSAGISNGACTGDEWCHTDLVTTATASCSSGTISAPAAAGARDAYVYILDYFNTEATGTIHGTKTSSSFSINNVAPTVTYVTLNSGNDITLTESSTKEVTITAQVSDNNGCNTLLNVRAYVYRSGIGYSGCDATATPNGNYCYKVPAEPELSCSTSNCSGTTADYTCTANMQYYADPTDTGSKFASENWLATVKATDGGSLTGNAQTTTGVEVKKLIAFSISPNNITYGNVGAGANMSLTVALTTRATGNVGINQTHHADSQTPYMCTNYSSCTGGTPISITKQQYSMTSGTAYGSGTSLSTSPATVLLKIKKPISSTAQQKNTYWGIEVPSGTVAGSYQGQNIITAVMSATSDW